MAPRVLDCCQRAVGIAGETGHAAGSIGQCITVVELEKLASEGNYWRICLRSICALFVGLAWTSVAFRVIRGPACH